MLRKGQSGYARQAKAIDKESIERFAKLTRGGKSQSLLKLDARRRKNIGGRKAGKKIPGRDAGKNRSRMQCPEKHPGTQGCLRQEAILSLFVDTDQFRLCETNKKHRERALSRRLLGSREDENSPFCLFLSLHLVLSMVFSETDTLRHFVGLLPRLGDQRFNCNHKRKRRSESVFNNNSTTRNC